MKRWLAYLRDTDGRLQKGVLLAFILVCCGLFPLAAQAIPGVRFPSLDSHFTKSRDTLRIFVIGDVMMHQAQIDADYEPFFRYIRPEMEKADICIANMEFSLGGEPYSGYPAFSAPDAFARYVKDCGVDVFLIANNHITDRGMAGLRRTVSFYRDSLQIPYAGVDDEPLMLVRKGIRLGLVNFTYGTNNRLKTREPHISLMREEGIHNAVDSARRAGADFLIALPHWGEEYVLTHSQQQEKFARFLVSEGFDAVVGAHPHVVQDTAHISSVPIIYSLGNAVSNMSAVNTRLSLAVTLQFVIDRTRVNGSGVSSGGSGLQLRMLEPQLRWMWCTLPGRLTHSYATIFVDEWIGRRDEWHLPSDYENMVATLRRVQQACTPQPR